MNKALQKRLAQLPTTPGLYFYRDKAGEIIYIGKAARLKVRVRQYFQNSRAADPKTEALISDIHSLDWRELDSEADALFLEAELVRRYQPRYNIMLRDDKSLLYIRIDYDSDYPTVTTLRRPTDDGARYFGPYLNGYAVKKALRQLRRAFPYATSRPMGAKRSGLHYHLGLDPGLEEGHTTLLQYRANLRSLMRYLRGQSAQLIKTIEKDMRRHARAKEYEQAARSRNQLFALRSLGMQVLFSDKENLDLSLDEALAGLAGLLGLDKPPRRIEAFDISHLSGQDVSASMVVFSNGVPDKTAYRKFKIRTAKNDDVAAISEALTRRLSPRNTSKWPLAQLVIIDGGKGQLAAAIRAREQAGYPHLPIVGLAKRFEEIIIGEWHSLKEPDQNKLRDSAQQLGGQLVESGRFVSINLPLQSPVIKLLQRIRDEAHRFAAAYQQTMSRRRLSASMLDDVPGLGPATRKKLVRAFGSTSAVLGASEQELTAVLGTKRGQQIYRYLPRS